MMGELKNDTNGPAHLAQMGNQLILPPIIMGGAGFSYQLHPQPDQIPISKIIRRAFDRGIRAIDTSPYYEPSEQLLGHALASPEIRDKYSREDYILMTKAGRISADEFNYSPDWIQTSVARSLSRLGTPYLDVVFCHDVEYVSCNQAVEAVGALFELKRQGKVRFVGISGYSIESLVRVARRVRQVYKQPLDVVQNWAQLTLQNSRLETVGIPALHEEGVAVICNSSPLASGLLRSTSVPSGKLGDWHPSPAGLREAVRAASDWVESQGSTLVNLALRFSIARAMKISWSDKRTRVHTIVGVSSISDIEDNVKATTAILQRFNPLSNDPTTEGANVSALTEIREEVEQRDLVLCQGVRRILGDWVDYDFEKKTKQAKL
jgi:aryl-alcohol dehydrogenase-like predicted oxidoreductase